MTKFTQVRISDGWFNIQYGKYYPGTKPSFDDEGEQADVDIEEVSFVDPEEEYENTIEGYMQIDSFMEELKEAVIEAITNSYKCSAAESRYEASLDNYFD